MYEFIHTKSYKKNKFTYKLGVEHANVGQKLLIRNKITKIKSFLQWPILSSEHGIYKYTNAKAKPLVHMLFLWENS